MDMDGWMNEWMDKMDGQMIGNFTYMYLHEIFKQNQTHNDQEN